jgi:hypothetical protein
MSVEGWIDDLARGLAGTTTRRSALKALAVAAAGGLASTVGVPRVLAAPGDPGDPAKCCRQARSFKDQASGSAQVCCPSGQVCFTCVAIGKEKGQVDAVAVSGGCCTPGVDCPGDVHGHHSQFCQQFVSSV